MRVGGVSTHAAGMSALWHDPDLDAPVKRFETPLVHKNYDEMPLPAEHVELPDGVRDPFAKLDAVYDAAAAQMDRGLKGAEFLHGKKAPPPVTTPDAATDAAAATAERAVPRPHDPDPHARVTRLGEGTPSAFAGAGVAQREQRLEREQQRAVDAAGNAYQPGRSSAQTTTAAQADAEKAARQGGIDAALPIAASFAPMAAAQVVTSTVQGPLPALAASAAHAVDIAGAVASAGQLTLTGVAEGLKDTSAETPRRGLRRR